MSYNTEILFVSPSYMKRTTYISNSVDEEMITTAVIVAQDKYVIPILGTDLYLKIRDLISTSTIATTEYETLLEQYLQKVTAWWALVELLPALYVRHDGSNLVIRNAENSTSITASDLHREVERSRQTAEMYTDRLVKHLRYNWDSKYPEYHTNTEDDIHPIKKVYGQSGMTFSQGRSYRSGVKHIIYPPSYG